MQIYNKYGFTDLELCKTYKDKEGNICFSSWHRFDKLMQDEKTKWNEFTERRIMDIEIILDYDEFICKKCYQLTSKIPCLHCKKEYTLEEQKELIFQFGILKINQLRRDRYKFKAYTTGSKGIHISLLFPELRRYTKKEREQYKEKFIIKYNGERGKKIDRVMIMLEGAKHRKTGKQKSLICEEKGYNKLRQL